MTECCRDGCHAPAAVTIITSLSVTAEQLLLAGCTARHLTPGCCNSTAVVDLRRRWCCFCNWWSSLSIERLGRGSLQARLTANHRRSGRNGRRTSNNNYDKTVVTASAERARFEPPIKAATAVTTAAAITVQAVTLKRRRYKIPRV